jgi:hypothetical protein
MPINFGSLQLQQLNGLFFSKNKKKRKNIEPMNFLKGELERKGKNETEQNQRNELNTRELIP